MFTVWSKAQRFRLFSSFRCFNPRFTAIFRAIVTTYIQTPWVSQVDNSITFFAEKVNVDCRYQRAERDEESTVVYDYCLTHQEKFVNPVMGFGRKRMKETHWKSVKSLAGLELKRYNINVDHYKDEAWETLHNPETTPGPRYMHLPIDLPGDIKKQLCSEEQVLSEGLALWRVKDGHASNHCWDCNVYADVAAEFKQVHSLRDTDAVQNRIRERAQKLRQSDHRRRPGSDFQEGMPDLV